MHRIRFLSVLSLLLWGLVLSPVASRAQPRRIYVTATRSAAECVALTHYRANPLTLRLTLDKTRPTATGYDSLVAEIRRNVTDTTPALASSSITSPTGAGPFDINFTGAQTNQDLAGKQSAPFWLVIYALSGNGEVLDVLHAGKLTLLEHGASLTAAAPPNVVGVLSRTAADLLYATIAELDVERSERTALGTAKLTALRAVFEGDSYFTGDWGNTSVPYLFSTFYSGRQAPVTNWATSGETVAQMVGQYAAQLHSSSPAVLTGQPAVAVIHGGINDIAGGATAATIYNNLKSLWASSRADGYLVCACTLASWTTDLGNEIVRKQLNALILSEPSLYDFIARFDTVLTGYRADFYGDPVHANAPGRVLLAKCAVSALRGFQTRMRVSTRLRTTDAATVLAAYPSNNLVPLVAVSDPAGRWSGGKFICPVDADYLITGAATVTATTTAADTTLSRIYVDSGGAVTPYKTDQLSGLVLTGGALTLKANLVVHGTTGSTIEWKVQSTVPLTTVGGAENGWLSIVQLPPSDTVDP